MKAPKKSPQHLPRVILSEANPLRVILSGVPPIKRCGYSLCKVAERSRSFAQWSLRNEAKPRNGACGMTTGSTNGYRKPFPYFE